MVYNDPLFTLFSIYESILNQQNKYFSVADLGSCRRDSFPENFLLVSDPPTAAASPTLIHI